MRSIREWERIRDGMAIPRRGKAIVSHDGYRTNEEKGATPDPLMGIFPVGFPIDAEGEAATAELYLTLADQYLGSPMLSAFYGAWAARIGDRDLALALLEEGYGKFCVDRFHQTLEYRADRFPEQPRAGPFFANIGGFLTSLLFGFTGLYARRRGAADMGEPRRKPARRLGGDRGRAGSGSAADACGSSRGRARGRRAHRRVKRGRLSETRGLPSRSHASRG